MGNGPCRPIISFAAMAGFFVSFEGGEGCGKSTQIGLLMAYWQQAGRDVLHVREPGGTAIGEVIRHLLKYHPENEAMTREAELLLFAAMLVLAGLNRWRLTPALGVAVHNDNPASALAGLRRSLLAEGSAALAILAVVAWLGTLEPLRMTV